MKYHSGRSKTQKRYINIILGFIAFGLFIYFWSAFRSAAYPFVEPIMRGYSSTKVFARFVPSFVTTYFVSHKTLSAQNKELEVQIERLENQLALKDIQIRESAFAQEAGSTPQNAPIIVMYPIAEDLTKLYSTILLSKGYRDGLEKGGIVYVRGQQAVCDIVEVYDKTSLCELLSKGDRVTEGVTSSSTLTLLLTGAGGGNFTAEVPRETAIAVGEVVYLRSDEGYVLGTVVAIKNEEQATGAKVFVRGAYNPMTSSIFYMQAKYAQ
jgi:cell shape-determining protein MreC